MTKTGHHRPNLEHSQNWRRSLEKLHVHFFEIIPCNFVLHVDSRLRSSFREKLDSSLNRFNTRPPPFCKTGSGLHGTDTILVSSAHSISYFSFFNGS